MKRIIPQLQKAGRWRKPSPHSVLRNLWIREVALCAAAACVAPALAQQDNPVYVDDSPQARELLRQAKDQTRENAGEAVRLYQELLDEFALKLVPVTEAGGDQFTSVRRRVDSALLADQALLDRYRLVQTPAAERLLQNGSLLSVATSYPLTEPGLEAMLRLAQSELEAGRFRGALAWLAQAHEHPDCVGRRAAHARFMAALALNDLGDDEASAIQRIALLELGADGETFERELNALMHAPRPVLERGVSVLDRGPEPALNDVVPQAIWTLPLEDSLLRRRMRAVQDNDEAGNVANAMDQRMRDADLATASVTVVGPTAYVNQGHTIVALDRLTGREAWSYQDLSRIGLTEPGNTLDALDMNMTAVEGDTLVTLTGHAQPNRRSDSGRVICIDAHDGEWRWSSPLSGIIDTAADEALFAHGQPILLEGRVFVLARKVSTQLLTSAFVVALDASDGTVLWSRHLASSGGLRIAARPFDSMVAHDGSLYVASAVGATARLDPATGEIRWLRRFNVPINMPIADQTRRPWEMAAPVITIRGLVTMQPDSRRVVLLDLATGDELANHSAGSSGDWNSPRYLLSDGPHVYSVGSDIRGFSVDNLEEPMWRIPAPAVQQAPDQPPPIESVELRGRVQLAGEHLIAPTEQGLLVIDAITGAVERTLALDGGGAAGNPLAYESQLLLAGADRLDAYMSLRRAEEMLRRQIAQAPDAPEPALSLLRLGMRAGDVGLALEAADQAMAATAAHADDPAFDARRFASRAELFELLLDLARSSKDISAEQGEAVFSRLERAAVGPEQRVQQLLAYGDWLATRALPRAIETWQTILSDERLAPVWLTESGIARPAWSRAVGRIGTVVASRGPSAYAPQSDFAALRLGQLRAAGAGVTGGGATTPDPDALLALVREFPFAPAAIDASLQAAEIRLARDEARSALSALVQSYRVAPTKLSAAKLIGRCSDIALQEGFLQQGRDALLAVRAQWGDIELESIDGKRRLSVRLNELGGAEQRLPRLGALGGDGLVLGAPQIAPARGMAGRMPADRALLRDGNSVKLITASQMDPVWTSTVEGSGPQALVFDAHNTVLWFGADAENPRAVRLDPADGSVLWKSPPVSEVFGPDAAPAVDRLRIAREQMPNGESYDSSETLALVDGDALILVQRTGAMAALSLADGKTVLWSRPAVLQQVHLSMVHDGLLVLAGMARDLDGGPPRGMIDRNNADAQQSPAPLTPRILVLDARTGRQAFGASGLIRPAGRTGIKWMSVAPLGVLVCGSIDGIEEIDLASGERQWSSSGYGALDSQRAWAMDTRIVFEDQRSRLRTIRLADGVVSDQFELPLRGEWDPLEMRDLIVSGDTVIAHYRARIVIFDPENGGVLGADAVPDDRDYRWLIEAEDRLEAISYSSAQPQVNAGGGGIRRTQYQYTAFPLSRNGKLLGAPTRTPFMPERVQQVTAIDGWLLFSTLTDTLAVPMTAR